MSDTKAHDVETGEADRLVHTHKQPEKKDDFFSLLKEVHGQIIRLDAYGCFIVKFLCVQIIRISGALSLVVLALIVHDSLDLNNMSNMDAKIYVAFAGVTLLMLLSQMMPPVMAMAVDPFKQQLAIAQSTSVVAKIFELEHNAMISTPTGEFAQLLTKVFMNVDKLLPALYGAVIPMWVEVIIAVIFIGLAYGYVALVQLALFGVYNCLAMMAAKKKAERNAAMLAAMFSEWAKILAIAGSYERAHFFDNVEREVTKARDAFQTMGGKIVHVAKGEQTSKLMLLALSLLTTGVWILCLPWLTRPNITLIEMAALALYIFMFVSALGEYAGAVADLRAAVLEYGTLGQFIKRRSGVLDVPNAVVLEPQRNPEIEFKNVTFSYGGQVILDDVSFKVKGGETLGLVGSSGCGKSTIMRLLLRFYRQSSGTITVNGVNIHDVTGRSLRRLFSVVTQDSALFNASIRDNIEYGKMGATTDEILTAAQQAELQFDDDLSLDKICGEKGAKLSGGQQQRVSLARAMLKNGTIYLLDEPTTGLDGVVAKSLQATMDKLAEHATTIMITHHLEDLRKAHQILYLDKGKIVERGTFAELRELGGSFFKQTEARNRDVPAPID
jgi:ABC-type multidrug transport system fused ATPase/permease subunit